MDKAEASIPAQAESGRHHFPGEEWRCWKHTSFAERWERQNTWHEGQAKSSRQLFRWV